MTNYRMLVIILQIVLLVLSMSIVVVNITFFPVALGVIILYVWTMNKEEKTHYIVRKMYHKNAGKYINYLVDSRTGQVVGKAKNEKETN